MIFNLRSFPSFSLCGEKIYLFFTFILIDYDLISFLREQHTCMTRIEIEKELKEPKFKPNINQWFEFMDL